MAQAVSRYNQQHDVKGKFAEGSGLGIEDEPWAWADDETRYPVLEVEPEGQLEWEASLTDGERQAIADYTGGSYQPMNGMLRGERLAGEDWATADAANTERIINMSEAIGKAPGYEQSVTVWRGVSMPGYSQDELGSFASNHFAPGRVIETKGYQSASFWTDPALDASLGQKNNGIIFEIRARQGARITSRLTKFDDEAEFVMPHRSFYRVRKVLHDVPFEKGEYGEVVTRTVVQLDQL